MPLCDAGKPKEVSIASILWSRFLPSLKGMIRVPVGRQGHARLIGKTGSAVEGTAVSTKLK
jgi:hypothetical protein